MGNTQSDSRHTRIWSNLCALTDDASRLKMLDVLLASPEHVNAAKQAGLYSGLLQWITAVRRGTYAPWPVVPQRIAMTPTQPNSQQPASAPMLRIDSMPQQQQYQQQLARVPPPKRALDTLHEAYAVLELDDSKPLSHELLRQAYKKSGYRTHPDRGGSPEAFDEVTRAYEYIQQVLEKLMPKAGRDDARFTSPVTVESAAAARASYPNPAAPGTLQLEGTTVSRDTPPIALNPKKLDMAVFNKLFEENQLPDPDKDDGYGEWIKSNTSGGMAADSQKLRGKYNKDMFNKVFEDEAKRVVTNTTVAVTKYAPPSELTLAPHMGVELGKTRPAQYTNPSGGKGMTYTDLKHAYGDGSTFSQEVMNVDLSSRPQTFEQAKREYGEAPKPMNPQEAAAVAAFEAAKKQAEETRQRRAAAHDVDVQTRYQQIQSRLSIKQ